MENISVRLRQVRTELEKNQVEMGKVLDMTKQAYGPLEKGTRKIHIKEIQILKKKYDINPNWLLFGEGNKKNIPNIKEKELVDLILDFRQYGGEADLVRQEITKIILSKLYKKKKWLYIFKKKHSYGNRIHFTLIKILDKIKHNGLEIYAKNSLKDEIKKHDGKLSHLVNSQNKEYIMLENYAKSFLRDEIEQFDDKSLYLADVKKELYSMIETMTEKDCYYLLCDTSFTGEEIKNRILKIDIVIKNIFSKSKI